MAADVQISKLEHFMAAVDSIERDGIILFRGQRNADWHLEPSLNRLNPDPGKTARDAERAMVDEYRRLQAPYAARQPPNDWELVAAAQHHGMLTRLRMDGKPPGGALVRHQKPSRRRRLRLGNELLARLE